MPNRSKKNFKVRDVAADRAAGGNARSRRSTNTRQQAKALETAGFGSGFDDEEGDELLGGEEMSGRGGARGARGGRGEQGTLMGGAKDIARNVGRSTRDAAQTTVEAARGWATGAADAAGSVAGKVRENPWPSLLIGAGATWLAVDAFRNRGENVRDSRRRAERGRNAVGEVMEEGRSAVNTAVSTVARAGRSAGSQIEGFVRENPFLAGAATLGIGMAVGMVLPSSVSENEVLGEVRDKVVRKAKEAAQDTMDKVRDVTETIERVSPFGGGSSSRRGSSNRGGSNRGGSKRG